MSKLEEEASGQTRYNNNRAITDASKYGGQTTDLRRRTHTPVTECYKQRKSISHRHI